MSEDTKSKLKEKLSAVISDEDLDNVAGGSFSENQELLVALGDIDPQGVLDFIKTWDQKAENRASTLQTGVLKLLQKNSLNSNKDIRVVVGADNIENIYTVGGKRMTHGQFIEMLKNMGKGDDF